MSAQCPSYLAPFGSQLQSGGRTGPFDCTAWSDRIVIATSTCGRKVPSGRTIRLLSNEPIPDPRSPGLNLEQAADVALDHYGVYLDVRKGYRKVTFDTYERRRAGGEPTLIQVWYAPIADSKYDAGRGFRTGHAMAETTHSTYDSLADGRAAGVWKFDGSLYPRWLIRKAAGKLVVNQRGDTVGDGFVWAAFGRDVIPDFACRVPKGSYFAYQLDNGKVIRRATRTTGGFSAICTPPRSYRWGSRTVTLVRLLSGAHVGRYISAKYATEG